ncbi:MAG: zinc ribbon domain-containing protein, partial [Clostridia bacterium]|nr:zinc ribbon domain-containing protein [Clostridia bacterium]
QSALEYVLSKNAKKTKTQSRVETEFVFILEDKGLEAGNGAGLNCPNCGAPVRNLGFKTCEYCGTGLVEIAKKVWTLNNIKEL